MYMHPAHLEAHSIQSAVQSAAASVKEHYARTVRVQFLFKIRWMWRIKNIFFLDVILSTG